VVKRRITKRIVEIENTVSLGGEGPKSKVGQLIFSAAVIRAQTTPCVKSVSYDNVRLRLRL
jgi:hypothetical protein